MSRRLLVFAVLACALAPGHAAGRPRPNKPLSAFDKGTKLYSEGKLPQALALYRGILRRNPGDDAADKAVRRIEQELAHRRPRGYEQDRDAWLDDLDETLVVAVPRWVNFEDTIGDALAGVGALEAGRGRVEQLLVERRFALKRGRRFRKDAELRAALRRLSMIVG